MEFWKNKVAIVTGAAHGIGAQITEDLLKAGMIVIGFEPTKERVLELAKKLENINSTNHQLIPCQCDISKEEDLKNAFEGIVAAYGGVDVLINNAAIGKAGMISTGSIEDMQHIVDVNIFGLIACSRLAIQSMSKKNRGGHIININSICGHYMPNFAEPKINMYVASKKAMTAINELMKKEFNSLDYKIKVTSVSPGIVRTGIFKNSGVEFINEDFFEKNPHLTTKDVSNVVIMVLSTQNIQINEIIFHALHELY